MLANASLRLALKHVSRFIPLQIDGEVRDRILIAVEDYARVLAPDEFRKAYDTLLVSKRGAGLWSTIVFKLTFSAQGY